MSSTLTLRVNIFTWKEKPCSPGATNFFLLKKKIKKIKKNSFTRKMFKSCSLTKQLLKILKVAKKLLSRIWKGLVTD